MTLSIKDLNIHWQEHLLDNRLFLLIETNEELIRLLSSWRFENPRKFVTNEFEVEEFTSLTSEESAVVPIELTGWEIEVTGISQVGSTKTFRLGRYEVFHTFNGAIVDDTWRINSGWINAYHLGGEYNMYDYLYPNEDPAHEYLEDIIITLLDDFQMKTKIEAFE